jgi:hypothetical protein
MLRRTTLYVLAPPVLIGVWAIGYFLILPQLPKRTGAEVKILPAIPVGIVAPESEPVDPVFENLLQPMEQARREWMQEMAAEREAMINHVYQIIDAADPEGRPSTTETTNGHEPPTGE